MAPEKLINEFVERVRTAAGTNLLAVILYGSAAAGDYVSEHSDVNLLCVLGETSYRGLRRWFRRSHGGRSRSIGRRC